jgi:hypothetical protein
MKFLPMLVGLAAAAWASAADASAMLSLSDYTPETSVPASWLDALMTFTVSGNTLTLDVENLTPDPQVSPSGSFRINDLYFNVSDKVTGMTLAAPPEGWALTFSRDGCRAGGLGLFDVRLKGGQGAKDQNQVFPGETTTFTIAFTGTGVTESDFTTEKSVGQRESLAAAKFVPVGDGTSARGAVAPEPATLALLGLGAAGVLLRRKRK